MNFVTWLQVVAAVTAAVSWNAAVAVPTLSLDPVFSPPSVIPTDPNLMVYNAPAMDHMLQEVRVLVRDSGGSLVTYPVTVTATTILSTNWNVVGNPGDMYNGTLCQHGRWFGRLLVCRYPYDDCIEMVCNTTDVVNYPLGQVTAETSNGVAAFPRFLHTVPSVANQRRLRFFATVEGVDLTAVTEPFDVQSQAAMLSFTAGATPADVFINEPMTFSVQTLTEDPTTPGTYIPLTSGRHSALNIDLTISYDSKVFYIFVPPTRNVRQIYSSTYTLAGPDVTRNGRMDLYIRKRCSSGAATFSNVYIANAGTDIRMNLTMTLPYYPYERWPPNYNDNVEVVNTWFYRTHSVNITQPPAVVLTSPFAVTVPPVNNLTLEATALSNFVPIADANFRFTTPLVIEVLDSNSRVITDGPDSTLTVDVEIDPAGECISADSSFSLVKGSGKFMGSICAPGSGIRLRFAVNSSTGTIFTTDYTPTITVSGDFRVAGMWPYYYEANYLPYLEAAKDLINQGYWSQEFVDGGRTFHTQHFNHLGTSVEETLANYDIIHSQNIDPNLPSVHAIIGGIGEDDTLLLSRTSTRHEMVIMGYVAENSELSDKSSHPYFVRVTNAESVRFFAEGAYFASHYWDRVIVIKDSNHPLPAVMFQGFEAHGVRIVLELTVPIPTTNDFSDLEPLDMLAQQVFAAGTRFIYSFTFSPSDLFLYQEAIRLHFAPIDGFIWSGSSNALETFPMSNLLGTCATTVPTCTTAFNSSILLSPESSVDETSPLWMDTIFETYLHVDPVAIVGAPVWRWPTTASKLARAHDGAVAIMLGAMDVFSRNETITGSKLSAAIRQVNFTGGTGEVRFDANGDKLGYRGAIYTYKPITDTPSVSNEFLYYAGGWTIDPVTQVPVETQNNERVLVGGATFHDVLAYAPIPFTNTRRVQGYRHGSNVLETLVSEVPAPYYCSEGCGGGLSDNANGTIYYWNYGTCVGMEACTCNNKPGVDEPGYAGSSCQQILCEPQCRNGQCISPDICQCEDFWAGADCGSAQCNISGCDENHGNCTGPNTCTCEPNYWGSDCSSKCTCVNGICNDGQGGTGACSKCSGSYVGANCDLSLPLVVVPTISAGIALITAIVLISIWYMRRMKFRAALASNDWIVDYNDVIIASEEGGGQSMAFRSMVSLGGPQKEKNMVRNQGKWNGVDVAIKMINKDSLNITTKNRLEVKNMRDIRQHNITHFVGACCDSPNVCILMESAPKGSLDDILSSNAINLDWNFKFSMLKDICRGMVYLGNSNIKSHGRLKSSNCVVDNRWTLKITDYGMHLFKSGQTGVPKFDPVTGTVTESEQLGDDNFEGNPKAALVYTAPEILRTGVTHLDHVGAGTIQGDMYSLAIIMVEVLTHETPFNDFLDYLEVDDVLDAIAGKKSITSQLPQAWPRNASEQVRPTIPDDADKEYVNLVKNIWVEDPAERPSFQQVLKWLNTLSPQKGDLMDNLVSMLEKYSTNLEAIVAERTQELEAEKAKTEELVCRMLPKAIAQQLMAGQTVSAETFECVTIYFSDIVGFTKIAGDSTPLQVVDLLNDLYTCFDAIIDHFDVYKVETIGDAYMVVSGLPLRNGDQHAGEIASMSLHLLSAILSFKIRHIPDRKLQLRAGIHSGPVVAGVVGLKMPRYCLFGDTVNTASRMESGGLALRVHMSETTADILMKLGGYELKSRGQREVKGKGVMTTYWLLNKEGFNRPLPTEEMAVSESQHEFK